MCLLKSGLKAFEQHLMNIQKAFRMFLEGLLQYLEMQANNYANMKCLPNKQNRALNPSAFKGP